MTASERIREARTGVSCTFCGSSRSTKFEGTRICSDMKACIHRIKAKS